jgi:hypothetical protein
MSPVLLASSGGGGLRVPCWGGARSPHHFQGPVLRRPAVDGEPVAWLPNVRGAALPGWNPLPPRNVHHLPAVFHAARIASARR